MVHDHEQLVAVVGELAASGLRLAFHAGSAGAIRPGLAESSGPFGPAATVVGGRRVATRAVDERDAPVGPEEEADADVPARLTAVLIVHRVDLAEVVGRPAGRLDRGDQPSERQVASATTLSFVAPLLSWISSRPMMSGAARL